MTAELICFSRSSTLFWHSMDQCQGDWKSCDQQTMEELSILGSILLKTVFLHLAYKTMVLLHSLTQSTVFNMSSELFYLKSYWKTFVSWTSVHAVWFFVSSDPLDECIFAKEHISNFFFKKVQCIHLFGHWYPETYGILKKKNALGYHSADFWLTFDDYDSCKNTVWTISFLSPILKINCICLLGTTKKLKKI